jgi:hypothetical protein
MLEFVTPELYRYVKQSAQAIAIKVIEGRYLFIVFVELTESDATFFPPAGGNFNLQAGRKAPIYPAFNGAFVYDTKYNRWGRMAHNAVEPG